MNEFEEINIPEFLKNGKKTILTIIVILITVIAIWKSSVTIEAGKSGVLFKPFSGGVDIQRTYDEGWHLIAPWNDMITYETRQQEVSHKMEVLCAAGLEISLEVSAWYRPQRENLGKLYQEKGMEYESRVVKPSLLSATRSVIGRYSPEEIYSSKKDAIQAEIELEAKKLLSTQYVEVMKTLVKDITLPEKIQDAIERKQEEEQLALQYIYKLDRAEKEAKRIKIEAGGKAEANRILNASLTANILKEKGLEATLKLAQSPNSKVVIVGGKDGLPIILGN